MKIAFKSEFQRLTAFAIDMTGFALWRSVGLRLERRHAENCNTGRIQGRNRVPNECIFVFLLNMFENIEGIHCIKPTRYRALENVMNEHLERPMRIHPLLDIVDK